MSKQKEMEFIFKQVEHSMGRSIPLRYKLSLRAQSAVFGESHCPEFCLIAWDRKAKNKTSIC